MKIIINHSKHLLVHDGVRYLPGTNVAEDFNAGHPIVAALVKSGKLEIIEKPLSAESKRKAVDNAAAAAVIADLEKHFKVSATETAERRKTIDAVDKSVNEELAKERPKKGD